MNLVVDIGNTRVKLAVFEQDKLIVDLTVKELNNQILNQFISKYTIKGAIISSVQQNLSDEMLKKYNFLQLSHLTPIPLQINYETPTTLGLDRISAVVGAQFVFSKTDLLVIDIGTCVTYDFVNAQNQYFGGSISPGFLMRFKALNQFTAKLPLVNFDENKLMLTGSSTEKSIISGVYYGLQNEINGVITQYLSQYKNLKIVVTGGDINRFDLAPKNRIFADKFLVLKGLNEILMYNEKR
jgi:type III pantothenate kinase